MGTNNLRLPEWSSYHQGARIMALRIKEKLIDTPRGKDEKVYITAILNLIISSKENAEKFMQGREIRYKNHVSNKRGKLLSCEAYFFKVVNVIIED